MAFTPRRVAAAFALLGSIAGFAAAIVLDSVVLALVASVALCLVVAAMERIPRSREW